MSKLSYLKIKWNEPELSEEQLKKYNEKARHLYWKVVRIELIVEEFLYKSINEVDWNKDFPFANKYAREISKIIYSDSDKILKQNDVIKFLTKKATLGNKIELWKSLKSNIFRNKNSIFSKIDESEITNILENTRNLRNSIAHYEGLQNWQSKMRAISGKIELDDIIKETLIRWGV